MIESYKDGVFYDYEEVDDDYDEIEDDLKRSYESKSIFFFRFLVFYYRFLWLFLLIYKYFENDEDYEIFNVVFYDSFLGDYELNYYVFND